MCAHSLACSLEKFQAKWKYEYYLVGYCIAFVIAVAVAVAVTKYNVETFPFPGVG